METLKTVVPAVETVIERMKSVNDAGSDVARFYNRFANKVGGSQKVPAGIMMAWELTAYDMCNEVGSNPLIFRLMAMDYNTFMHSIFAEDKPFADACIAWRNEVLNSTK
jgi:hypothetical protein